MPHDLTPFILMLSDPALAANGESVADLPLDQDSRSNGHCSCREEAAVRQVLGLITSVTPVTI